MLSDTFVDAARQERKRLFAELSKTPLFHEWWTLRKLLVANGLGQEDDVGGLGEVNPPPSRPTQNTTEHHNSQRASRPGSRATQVAEAAAGWLAVRQRRAQSLEIMKALISQGFTFTGAKPTAALASILSHSDLFNNVRGEGYGLRSWSNKEPHTGIDYGSESNAEHQLEAATPDSESPLAG